MSDPDTRDVYDRFGLEGLARGGGGGGPGYDFFNDFFSFGFASGGPGSRKSRDSIIRQDVTLEDVYNGKHVKMNAEKKVICNICDG